MIDNKLLNFYIKKDRNKTLKLVRTITIKLNETYIKTPIVHYNTEVVNFLYQELETLMGIDIYCDFPFNCSCNCYNIVYCTCIVGEILNSGNSIIEMSFPGKRNLVIKVG